MKISKFIKLAKKNTRSSWDPESTSCSNHGFFVSGCVGHFVWRRNLACLALGICAGLDFLWFGKTFQQRSLVVGYTFIVFPSGLVAEPTAGGSALVSVGFYNPCSGLWLAFSLAGTLVFIQWRHHSHVVGRYPLRQPHSFS